MWKQGHGAGEALLPFLVWGPVPWEVSTYFLWMGPHASLSIRFPVCTYCVPGTIPGLGDRVVNLGGDTEALLIFS